MGHVALSPTDTVDVKGTVEALKTSVLSVPLPADDIGQAPVPSFIAPPNRGLRFPVTSHPLLISVG